MFSFYRVIMLSFYFLCITQNCFLIYFDLIFMTSLWASYLHEEEVLWQYCLKYLTSPQCRNIQIYNLNGWRFLLKIKTLSLKKCEQKNQRKILTMEKRNLTMTSSRHIDNHLFSNYLRFRTLTSLVALLH